MSDKTEPSEQVKAAATVIEEALRGHVTDLVEVGSGDLIRSYASDEDARLIFALGALQLVVGRALATWWLEHGVDVVPGVFALLPTLSRVGPRREADIIALTGHGISISEALRISGACAAARHEVRVQATLDAIRAVVRGPYITFCDDLAARFVLQLDLAGIGGRHGIGGAATARLLTTLGFPLGKGRWQATDAGAWRAAAEEALGRLGGPIPDDRIEPDAEHGGVMIHHPAADNPSVTWLALTGPARVWLRAYAVRRAVAAAIAGDAFTDSLPSGDASTAMKWAILGAAEDKPVTAPAAVVTTAMHSKIYGAAGDWAGDSDDLFAASVAALQRGAVREAGKVSMPSWDGEPTPLVAWLLQGGEPTALIVGPCEGES